MSGSGHPLTLFTVDIITSRISLAVNLAVYLAYVYLCRYVTEACPILNIDKAREANAVLWFVTQQPCIVVQRKNGKW